MSKSPDQNRLYDVTEVAERLHVSVGVLRVWTAGKKIPFTRIGRFVRFTEEQVQAIIASGAVEPLTDDRTPREQRAQGHRRRSTL